MTNYKTHRFPKTRVATFDVGSIGRTRHHVSSFMEFDVTESRTKIKELRKQGHKISFTAWMLKVISKTIKDHEKVAGYLFRKRKIITFNDINISVVVEKEVEGNKVPIPLIIEKTNEKDISTITKEIEDAKNVTFSNKDIVLGQSSSKLERLYYLLPGAVRKMAWRYLLNRPEMAYRKMGNVVVTAVGMMGQLNAWFIQTTVHPISIGIGSVIKKAVVVHNEIKIREMLNITILFDHNVVDGAPMARFIHDLKKNIETGIEL